MAKPRKVFVLYINGKTLKSVKSLVLIDLLLGTGFYFAAKIMTSSLLIASLGSMAGSEGVKWRLRRQRTRVITVPVKKPG
ncbi:hypothetical protein [Paenibacillus pinistramenti]|uniref:hypothetical protein n=1 Tax=Paenibacillus pinistramenti TaxID=1768003 RepID=UPI001109A354|nr:hypothetical protein [Paenibacillus pinistramenti]